MAISPGYSVAFARGACKSASFGSDQDRLAKHSQGVDESVCAKLAVTIGFSAFQYRGTPNITHCTLGRRLWALLVRPGKACAVRKAQSAKSPRAGQCDLQGPKAELGQVRINSLATRLGHGLWELFGVNQWRYFKTQPAPSTIIATFINLRSQALPTPSGVPALAYSNGCTPPPRVQAPYISPTFSGFPL